MGPVTIYGPVTIQDPRNISNRLSHLDQDITQDLVSQLQPQSSSPDSGPNTDQAGASDTSPTPVARGRGNPASGTSMDLLLGCTELPDTHIESSHDAMESPQERPEESQ